MVQVPKVQLVRVLLLSGFRKIVYRGQDLASGGQACGGNLELREAHGNLLGLPQSDFRVSPRVLDGRDLLFHREGEVKGALQKDLVRAVAGGEAFQV